MSDWKVKFLLDCADVFRLEGETVINEKLRCQCELGDGPRCREDMTQEDGLCDVCRGVRHMHIWPIADPERLGSAPILIGDAVRLEVIEAVVDSIGEYWPDHAAAEVDGQVIG